MLPSASPKVVIGESEVDAVMSGKSSRADDTRAAVEKYKDVIYSVALAHTARAADADDVFQEVFLAYMRNAPVFNGDEHEKAWLIRTALNQCKKLTGSTYARRSAPLEDADALSSDFRFETETENAVWTALCSLPETCRTAMQLFYFEELSIAEVCRVLKLSEGAVKMRLMRGRELMRERLKEDFFE